MLSKIFSGRKQETFYTKVKKRNFKESWKKREYLGFYGGRKTSLLRKLKAQTLPDETPPIDMINPFNPFNKIAETLNQ